MRLFPPPYEGLDPAYPVTPAPLPCSKVWDGAVNGAFIGVLGTLIGAFRKRPGMGLTYAAYGTLGSSLVGIIQEVAVTDVRIEYLQEKGIRVPRRSYYERLGSVDYDNFAILGAATGIVVAASSRRLPTVQGFTKYFGAASFGVLGAHSAMLSVQWPKLREGINTALRQEELWSRRKPEADNWPTAGLSSTYTSLIKLRVLYNERTKSEPQTSQVEHQPIADVIGGMFKHGQPPNQAPEPVGVASREMVGEFVDAMDDIDEATRLDETDPKPHLSAVHDGERVFQPATNYRWSVGPNGEVEMKAHLAHLQAKRLELSREAELVWHKMAVKEAEFYKLSRDHPEKDLARAALQVLNVVHVSLWTEISVQDWMIADTNKNLLQWQAIGDKSAWIPSLPANSTKINPKYSFKVLENDLYDTQYMLDEMRQARDQVREDMSNPDEVDFIDSKTGERPKDKQAFVQGLLDMAEKGVKDLEEKERALQDLLEEMRSSFGR